MINQVEEQVEFAIKGFGPGEVAQAEAVKGDVEAAGGTAEVKAESEGEGFVFIPIILGAMALVGLAHAVHNFLNNIQEGVVIDTRSGKVITTKDPNLPRGLVVVIAGDGTAVTLHQPDKVSLADAVKAAKDAILDK